MEAVVGIISRCDLDIDVHNNAIVQYRSKLAMFSLLLSL